MREIADAVLIHIRSNLLTSFVIALIAGAAACRSVTTSRLSGPVVYCLIGMTGMFASQFLFIHLDLIDSLEQMGSYCLLIDLCATYSVSVLVAAIINAINPN